MLKQSLRLRHIVPLACLLSSPISLAANTVIDVLVAYTPSVGTAYGGDPTTRINQLFTLTNKIYQDRGFKYSIGIAFSKSGAS